MRAAENEVDRIMKETDDIFNANPNREDSGRIIFEKLAPLMDEAMKKSVETYEEWHQVAENALNQGRKELEELEKELEQE
ncbi:MAG: hypothetical protein COX77_04810 [Candidatus Komeilibacteria bacterium CG_4_10_14_0_2_um_filter_37_10]|uniref:Uncharacterized protein n=1 Tax=Candidatus Komeilibacteria bacterium CG_4_10_14_0_2_um_filter_37_10 TaxID=1974470 RepID=A0A2M7VD94_9BACT|nr:MAG: hypothetical protein COX77_04810 [Candidatus Komeilibacteria bacterium CG_4_10_14_0_2_um_filter_37_10]PJA93932.1 MAG: hypothetical protein CO133_00885 [Candidatus Komeilibacteria bacterium CG_4_9_14_3_um_filter_37_5]